jgi:hypothetical protein
MLIDANFGVKNLYIFAKKYRNEKILLTISSLIMYSLQHKPGIPQETAEQIHLQIS